MSNLVVISGPSGAGKSTITNAIISKHKNFILSISATTRAKRDGEIDGRDYFFLTPSVFEENIKKGNFLEYIKIFNNYYGTLKNFIIQNRDKNIILDIDYIGANNLKQEVEKHNLNCTSNDVIQLITIFILPDSLENLYDRLKKRGENEDSINIRINRAKEEIKNANNYDFYVKNIVLETAIQEVENILHSKKLI